MEGATAAGIGTGLRLGLASARQRRLQDQQLQREQQQFQQQQEAGSLALARNRFQFQQDQADLQRRVKQEGLDQLVRSLRAGVDPQYAFSLYNQTGADKIDAGQSAYDPKTGQVHIVSHTYPGRGFSGSLDQLAAVIGEKPVAPIKLNTPGGGQELVTRTPAGGYSSVYRPPQALPKPDDRSRKIAALQSQLIGKGMDPQKARDYATNVTDGNLRMNINPQTGSIVFTDIVNGTAHEVPLANAAGPVPTPAPGQTMWDAANLGTGPISGAAAGISAVSGALGGPVADQTIKARQTLKLGAQSMSRALANNPRFPVAERKWLQDELSLLPSLVDNSKAMHDRMETVDSALRTWLAQAQRNANDTSLPVSTRQAQKQKAAEIQDFLAQLGVPRKGQSAPPEQQTGMPPGWKVEEEH